MRPSRLRWDLLPTALLGLVGAIEIVAAGYAPVWLALATYLLAAGVLCAGRFAPLAVPLLVTAIYATTPLLGFDVSKPASWVPLIAFACLGTGLYAPRSRRLAGLASVLGALALVFAGLKWLTDFEPSLLFGLIMTVGAWALGLALREALDRSRLAGAEAERARVGGALAGKRAAESERERIALELHDVLAHSLGAMVVQSSVAGDLVRADASAAAALSDVAQAGRDALAETGRLLRLLRDDLDELGLGSGTASDLRAERAPDGVAAAPVLPRRDVLLPALFGVIATAEIVSGGYEPLWASLAAYWLAVGVLCARRAYPLAMPIAITAIFVGARPVEVCTARAGAGGRARRRRRTQAHRPGAPRCARQLAQRDDRAGVARRRPRRGRSRRSERGRVGGRAFGTERPRRDRAAPAPDRGRRKRAGNATTARGGRHPRVGRGVRTSRPEGRRRP